MRNHDRNFAVRCPRNLEGGSLRNPSKRVEAVNGYASCMPRHPHEPQPLREADAENDQQHARPKTSTDDDRAASSAQSSRTSAQSRSGCQCNRHTPLNIPRGSMAETVAGIIRYLRQARRWLNPRTSYPQHCTEKETTPNGDHHDDRHQRRLGKSPSRSPRC